MSKLGLPIRLPGENETGIEFLDWLDQRVAGNRLARQRLVAFIEEWDLVRDEVRDKENREPTVSDYAQRWRMPESSAYRFLEEYRRIFRTPYPGDLCDLLWGGMPKWTGSGPIEMLSLMAVKVVDSG
jgi:hypothetical protein